MKTVYVLMYKEAGQLKPYAVFEDSITAERMKRDGDEIVRVPYFREDFPNTLRITEDSLIGTPLNVPCETQTTWTRTPWTPNDGTLAPFPPPSYPKVTCQKTVDEHTWRDRVD